MELKISEVPETSFMSDYGQICSIVSHCVWIMTSKQTLGTQLDRVFFSMKIRSVSFRKTRNSFKTKEMSHWNAVANGEPQYDLSH